MDTGFIAGRHGPFNNTHSGSDLSTAVFWDNTAYPVLNTSYTGLYRCRADTGNSMATYQLNVRGKFTLYSSRYSIMSTLPGKQLLLVCSLMFCS